MARTVARDGRAPGAPPAQLGPETSVQRDGWLSAVYLLLLLASGAIPNNGALCFEASSLVLVMVLGLRALQGGLLSLDVMWAVGFLYTIAREGILNTDRIVRLAGAEPFNRAAQFLCAANAATLLALTYISRTVRAQRFLVSTTGRPPAPSVRATALVASLYVLTLATTLGQAIQQFSVGRLVAERDVGNELVASSFMELAAQAVLVSVSTALPALVAYELVIRRKRWMLSFVACAPIIAMQIVLGTRYLLLLSAGGMLAVFVSASLKRWTSRVGAFGLTAAALLVASAIMARFRNQGLAAFDLAAFTHDSRPVLNYEDVVLYVALLVKYCGTHGHAWGTSTMTIVLFWIPRAVWPGKPTLLGYWFPRELGFVKNFSGGYSAAVSFAGDAYLDFGFIGGVMFALGLGACLGTLDVRLRKAIVSRDITLPVLGPLIGAAFFAVRSLDTTLISYSGIVLIWLLYRWLSRDAAAGTRAAA